MGTMLSENWPDAIEKGLRTYVIGGIKETPTMYQDLFHVLGTTNATEVDSSASGFPDFSEFTGTVPYDSGDEGYKRTYSFPEYAAGFKVERKLASDNLYNIINRRASGLGEAAKRSKDKLGAQVYDEAFTTAPTDGDTKELCASDHPSTVDGVAAQSNEGTTALAATAVEATRILMRRFRGAQGELLSVEPDLLIVPLDKEEVAWEIISSKGKVDHSTNNANYHYGKYKLAVWPRLSDTTDWFMADSRIMKRSLFYFNREPIQFWQDKDSDTLLAKYISYFRCGTGWNDWRWVFGQLVA